MLHARPVDGRGLRRTTDSQDAQGPREAPIDLRTGGLVSAFFTTGLRMAVIGRPRTHRPAALARVRDLRKAPEPKDPLGRLYGPAFDGTTGNGSAVTPAPLLWLPSDTQDVVIAGPGTPSYGPTRQGRGFSSLTSIQGAGDLVGGPTFSWTPPTGCAGTWSSMTGAPEAWHRLGCRQPDPSGGLLRPRLAMGRPHRAGELQFLSSNRQRWALWAWWDGARTRPWPCGHASTAPSIDTSSAICVWSKWTPDRAVVASSGTSRRPRTRTEVLITLSAGWLAPHRCYTPPRSGRRVGILPVAACAPTRVLMSLRGPVNSGALTTRNMASSGRWSCLRPLDGDHRRDRGRIAGPRIGAVERLPCGRRGDQHPAGADTLGATQYPGHGRVPDCVRTQAVEGNPTAPPDHRRRR